jgi:hypothetical protein
MPRSPLPPPTDPSKPLCKKIPALPRFLPCFFDVPLKSALEILGLSHHTLDKVRRTMSIDRWPYAEMTRGRFFLKGVRMLREDIVALRAQMMSEADVGMQQILCRMATRSEECWSNAHPRTAQENAQRASQREHHEPPTPAPENAQRPPQREHHEPPTPAPEITQHVTINVWEEPARDQAADAEFWEEIARLFSLHVGAMQQEPSTALGAALEAVPVINE